MAVMDAFPFTLGFIAGLVVGIGLMIGLWKWLEHILDEQDKRGS